MMVLRRNCVSEKLCSSNELYSSSGISSEKQGHHPEIFNVYNTIKIVYMMVDGFNKKRL
jgi:pterin-4a-carbinolamine dehydratase